MSIFSLAFSPPALGQAARPLVIPPADAVDRIVIVLRSDETVLRDRTVISQFVAFLTAHNNGWRRPLDTFPTPRWTIRLEGKKELILVLWLSPNWLGGREGKATASDNRLRDLSPKDYAKALGILGMASN